MDEAQAAVLVRRMCAAHRQRPDADAELELVKLMVEFGCESCAWEQAQWVRDKGQRVPTRPQFYDQLTQRMDSAAHATHGGDAHADAIGDAEAWWHRFGIGYIRSEIGCDRLEGEARAALMWASEVVTQSEVVVRQEASHPSWTARLPQAGVTQEFVTFVWDYARAVARVPVSQWTDEVFDQWSRRWSEQMHPAGSAL